MQSASDIAPPAAAVSRPAWRVLLVDDEPGVHEVSRLVLAEMAFDGRPVELLSAYSATEAREQLEQQRDIALVVLDVVMETDDAGLALVRHIREQRDDQDVQIVLRTGQPGMAPEREVILRYDINGYFLKTEITAQKLYSIVISALRAFRYTRSLRGSDGAGVSDNVPVQAHESRNTRDASLQAEIVAAATNGGFTVLAQAEFALSSSEPIGIGLVPQWRTGAGVLGAARVAEIVASAPHVRRELTVQMLHLACAWADAWRAARVAPVQVSLALFGEELEDTAWLDALRSAMTDRGLTTGMLDVQIPEAALRSRHPPGRDALRALQSLGVSVTLLEFGSGAISLPLLYRLQPNRIKIHRGFVRGVTADAERMAMARSLIALAHTLGIVVIADGISADSDLQFFKWEGCDVGSGDLLAPACAPAEVARLLATGKSSTH